MPCLYRSISASIPAYAGTGLRLIQLEWILDRIVYSVAQVSMVVLVDFITGIHTKRSNLASLMLYIQDNRKAGSGNRPSVS